MRQFAQLMLLDLGGVRTLGHREGIDGEQAHRYAASLEIPTGGFHGGIWDDGTDVEYTFYGLGAIALLA